MVVNYTNKHVTFNKGQCIGHMEPLINKMSEISVNSVIAEKMMNDKVQPDTFTPPLHNRSAEVNKLLESFISQFAKVETCIDITNLTKMQIDIGNSEPVSRKPYPIDMKN